MNDIEAGENVLLVRVEHFFEANEDKEMSVEVAIDLRKVFGSVVNVVGVKEMALGGNMGVEELSERLEWMREEGEMVKREEEVDADSDGFVFGFSPMQIRTFRLWYLD